MRLESEAILALIKHCQNTAGWLFFASDALDNEINRNPDFSARQKVLELYELAEEKIYLNDAIIERAKELWRFDMGSSDAIHGASAEFAEADVLLTTDEKFLRRAKRSDLQIRVENPVIWLLEVAHGI
jgi:predicted nucleic acid-binding protein